MAPTITAGQFLRPLDAPRPAEPTPSRTPDNGDGFKTYLNDARTTVGPRKSDSTRSGEPVRDRKPVDRDKNSEEAPDSNASPTGTQAPSQPPPSGQQQPDANSPVASAEVTTQAAPQATPEVSQPTVQSNAAYTNAPIQLQTVSASIPAPVTKGNDATANVPASQTSAPKATVQTPAVEEPDEHPVEFRQVTPLPELPASDAPDPDSVEPATESPQRPPICTGISDEHPFGADSNFDLTEAGEWKTEEEASVRAKVVPRTDPKPHIQPASIVKGDSAPSERAATIPVPREAAPVRPSDGIQAEPPPKLELGNGRLSLNRGESILKVDDTTTEAPRLPRVSVRSGTGDASAAAVGRFLIETIGDDQSTTANAPQQNHEHSTAVSQPSFLLTQRPVAPTSQSVDVTGTTLTRLTVSGTEGQDPIDAAAKILSGSQRDGNHRVTLQLDPPELGQLRLDIRMEQNDMTLRVAADNVAVGKLIESRLSELRDALAVHGIRIDRSDVVVRSHGTENSGLQFSNHGGSSNTADDGRRVDQAPVNWSDESRWGAGRNGQGGADPQHADGSAFAEEETAVTATAWEPSAEGVGIERTWVNLVA